LLLSCRYGAERRLLDKSEVNMEAIAAVLAVALLLAILVIDRMNS
jgi:hypothetical protein